MNILNIASFCCSYFSYSLEITSALQIKTCCLWREDDDLDFGNYEIEESNVHDVDVIAEEDKDDDHGVVVNQDTQAKGGMVTESSK